VSPERRRSLRGAIAVALTGIAVLICAAGFATYQIWDRTRGSAPARHTSSAIAATLAVTVTGRQCQVFIRVPGGDILINRTLARGQSVRFDDPRLNVVLSDAGAVRVYVNGRLQPAGAPGRRAEFTAVKG
jgi:hypothetical protein